MASGACSGWLLGLHLHLAVNRFGCGSNVDGGCHPAAIVRCTCALTRLHHSPPPAHPTTTAQSPNIQLWFEVWLVLGGAWTTWVVVVVECVVCGVRCAMRAVWCVCALRAYPASTDPGRCEDVVWHRSFQRLRLPDQRRFASRAGHMHYICLQRTAKSEPRVHPGSWEKSCQFNCVGEEWGSRWFVLEQAKLQKLKHSLRKFRARLRGAEPTLRVPALRGARDYRLP